MKCQNCQTELPASSRFCLRCGAPQPFTNTSLETEAPLIHSETLSADAGAVRQLPMEDTTEFNWLAREFQLDPGLDYEAARQYEGTTAKAIGCLGYFYFGIVGVISLVVVIPLLAIFGVPGSLVLGMLNFFNIGNLNQKLRTIKFFSQLPGVASLNRVAQSLSVVAYVLLASVVAIAIMRATSA